ncbi:MAG: DUF2630 family protein [Dehalococcoidia bacterium]|nr:DUF2630 family protein [Dehalococcoidia bacterium]
MEDKDVLGHIGSLVEEEKRLRGELRGAPEADPRHQRLHSVEVSLDQCWDLLRQRRGRRHAGEDADAAQPRSPDTVEGYVQ